MKRPFIFLIICSAITELACSPTPNNPNTATPANNSSSLQLQVNGEKLITEGLTSKDDWQVQFDHAYVHLNNVTASQKSNVEANDNQEINQVLLLQEKTIDLTKNDKPKTTILVSKNPAKEGHYNSLSWQLNNAKNGPISGYSLVLIGNATKNGKTLPFHIEFDQPIAFTCGEYVGDERKGVVTTGETADLEITLHFDHLFGNKNLPLTDDVNQGAFGFSPLAELAENQQVKLNIQQLKAQLTPANWQKLQNILLNLGHVGEGHCQGQFVAS